MNINYVIRNDLHGEIDSSEVKILLKNSGILNLQYFKSVNYNWQLFQNFK